MRKSWKERNKYMRKNERNANDNIRRIITPSILGIMICMVCLAGTTWAWFTATQDATVATSQVASFNVEVAIDGKDLSDDNKVIRGNDEKTYTIDANAQIKVTLESVGDANSGYCKVEVDGVTYHTSCINKDGSYSFTVCAADGKITISPSWKSITAGSLIEKDKAIGKGTPPSKQDEDNSDNQDAVINKDEKNDGNDSTPAQGGDDNNSDDSSAPAQEDAPEQGIDSESGASETHVAE